MTYVRTLICIITLLTTASNESVRTTSEFLSKSARPQQDTFEQFADRLVAASEKERNILIEANRRLVTPALINALFVRGEAARRQRRFPESLSIYSIAQTLAEKLPDELLIAQAITEQGLTDVAADNTSDAFKLLDSAYAYAKAARNLKLLSRIEAGRAEAYLREGNLVAALDAAKKAEEQAPIDDPIAQGDAYTLLGRARGAMALYQEAFPEFERAIRAYGNNDKALVVLNEEAALYSDAGEPDESVRVYDRMLAMLERVTEDNRYRRLNILINKGLDQALSGHATEGLETIRVAIPLFRKSDGDVVFVSAKLNQAVAANLAHNRNEALASIKSAYEYANESKQTEAKRPLNTIRIEWSRLLLDNEYATPEDIQQAIKLSEEALGNTHPKDLEGRWTAYVAVGNAYLTAKRYKDALESFTQATQLIDQIVQNIGDDPESIAAYLADKADIFEAVARLLSDEGKTKAALLALENARARGLFSVIERGAPQVRQGMRPSDRERETIAKLKLAQANRQMSEGLQDISLTQSMRTELAEKLQKARAEWASLRLLLGKTYPGLYRASRQIVPLTEQDLADLVPEDTAVLEYILNDTDAIGFVTVRSASGSVEVHSFQLGADPSTIRNKIANYQILVSNEQGIYETAGKNLYQVLIAKAEPFLLNKSRIIFVPTAQLWQVPFQALILSGGQFLVEKYAISYVASLSILHDLRKRPRFSREAARQLVVFANPSVKVNPEGARNSVINRKATLLMDEPLVPLVQIEEQAKRLGQQLRRTRFVYTGSDATELRFRYKAQKATAIYLAVHGIVNNDAPLFSRIVLTGTGNNTDDDGVVEAWEVLEMKVHASLVVLAACDTAGGRVTLGEGMIGLSWAFSVAGCPRLIASQWRVPEKSTMLLIDTTMRRMFGLDKRGRRAGRSFAPDFALQEAAKERIHDKETRHPWHWAAFEVIGDSL